ncbi:MAG: D-aminoacyl-tRNA deacylase [Steroidobacteraceae bacterium]|nr:D-aminoacyl-tRNA deacylase [Steroidobacteraceae bacterium]MDW8259242.1 D-aminoacyl-tRNA deacylase [Gammaproteobacteria bacterium]
MIALIQRVQHARVEVSGEIVGAIGPGLLALIGVQRNDGEIEAMRLLDRMLGYRVFDDEHGRMNRSVTDTVGGLLLVPQFTLAADTDKGTRPSFSPAADPGLARRLFEALLHAARARHRGPVASGRFGAEMIVHLANHGPVTFWLET